MENHKVSIIIPIYKVEKYLHECLDSCINQTYTNIEIIAVNDGSPDSCGDIIDSYAAKDSRVIHVRKSNEGISKARETGTNTSTGDYIMYVDGDDFITHNAVEMYMEVADKEDADMVLSDYINHYENKKNNIRETALHNGLIIKDIDNYFSNNLRMEMWGRVIKRELCLGCETQKLNMGEDMFTIIQIVMKCHKIVYLKIPLYYYRHNEASLMHSTSTVKNEINHKLYLTDFIVRKNYPPKIMKLIILNSVMIVSKYCNDYDNPITAAMKEDVKRFTALSLKYYPTMLREKLFSDKIRGIIVFYLIHYFPNSVKLIHKYNKLRGKKNHEL